MNNKKLIKLHIPDIYELDYRRHLISDKDTMSYNIGWGDDGSGCYYQTAEQVLEWYKNWNNDSNNYYAYIAKADDDSFVGEVNIHWNNNLKKYIVGVTIESKHRGFGYAKEALLLLAEKAFFELGIESLFDDFPADRIAAEKTYTSIGFVRINDDLVELTRDSFYKMWLNMPEELSAILAGYILTKDGIGCSSAGVYHCQKGSDSLYLKIQKPNAEFKREDEITKWLNGKLPVPKIKYFSEHEGLSYLLMTAVDGHMACNCPTDELCKPYENTIKLLADGLLMLQGVDTIDCPFDNSLDIKLKAALYNIENNLVDMDDFEDGNDFATPMDLYTWLTENKPPEELCFCHGDYCLPNIFIENNAVTGFIDLGRAGIADKWQDIALCVRSIGYNLRNYDGKDEYINMLFEHLKLEPDWDKINYYILLDELF